MLEGATTQSSKRVSIDKRTIVPSLFSLLSQLAAVATPCDVRCQAIPPRLTAERKMARRARSCNERAMKFRRIIGEGARIASQAAAEVRDAFRLPPSAFLQRSYPRPAALRCDARRPGDPTPTKGVRRASLSGRACRPRRL